MRSCLRLKAALTRLNTSLIAQHGALAALRDADYLAHAQGVVRGNLAHLETTLAGIDGLELTTSPGARAGLRAGHVGRRASRRRS